MKVFEGYCECCGAKGTFTITRVKRKYPEFNELLVKEKRYMNFIWEVEGLCIFCSSSVCHKLSKNEIESLLSDLGEADEILINWWRRA